MAILRSLNSIPRSHGVWDCIYASTVKADVFQIPLYYPRVEGQISAFEIGLIDRKSVNGIRLSYDYIREGWVIKQNQDSEGILAEEYWEEVAFIDSQSQSPGTEVEYETNSRYDFLEFEVEEENSLAHIDRTKQSSRFSGDFLE